MPTDRELLEEINNGLKAQGYKSTAFVLIALAIALWGWGVSKSSDIFFYIGFAMWGLGFIILLVGIFKK